MFKALIVDDESKSRLTLSRLLEKYCPIVEVVAEASTVDESIAYLKNNQPDLLFLDIQLTDGTGFDILTSVGDIRSKIVFTTAYDQYAIQAFKFSAVDYLLKPIDPDQLISLCDRLQKMTQGISSETSQQLNALIENKQKIKKIALHSTQGVQYIFIDDILRCEADSNYTTFFLKDEQKIVVSKSLKEYEELLSGINFLRVHKSHLVNMDYVKKYDSRTGILYLIDEYAIEVARRRKDVVAKHFSKTV
jgi:two-component system LytT family response regulator